jgi:hypothetical protein
MRERCCPIRTLEAPKHHTIYLVLFAWCSTRMLKRLMLQNSLIESTFGPYGAGLFGTW